MADGVDVGATNLVGSRDVVFEVDVVTQIHLVGDCAEDQSLLASIRKRKLDLAIQTTGSKKRWVECIGTVGSHDHLHCTLNLAP